MSAPIPDGFAQARIFWSITGDPEPVEITFGIDSGAASDADTLAEFIYTSWIAQFTAATFWDGAVLTKVTVTMNVGGDLIDGEHTPNTVGSAAFNPMSMSVCMLLKKRTAAGGRKNRGRCYLPNVFLGELSVTPAGLILNVLVDDTTDRWSNFIVALAAGAVPMVILHGDSSAPTGVIDGSCELYVATQRRRQR